MRTPGRHGLRFHPAGSRGLIYGFVAANVDLGFTAALPEGRERGFVRPVVGFSAGVLGGGSHLFVAPGANAGLLAFAPLGGSSWLRLDVRVRMWTTGDEWLALYSLGVGFTTLPGPPLPVTQTGPEERIPRPRLPELVTRRGAGPRDP